MLIALTTPQWGPKRIPYWPRCAKEGLRRGKRDFGSIVRIHLADWLLRANLLIPAVAKETFRRGLQSSGSFTTEQKIWECKHNSKAAMYSVVSLSESTMKVERSKASTGQSFASVGQVLPVKQLICDGHLACAADSSVQSSDYSLTEWAWRTHWMAGLVGHLHKSGEYAQFT
jgi:hypothetical protein